MKHSRILVQKLPSELLPSKLIRKSSKVIKENLNSKEWINSQLLLENRLYRIKYYLFLVQHFIQKTIFFGLRFLDHDRLFRIVNSRRNNRMRTSRRSRSSAPSFRKRVERTHHPAAAVNDGKAAHAKEEDREKCGLQLFSLWWKKVISVDNHHW